MEQTQKHLIDDTDAVDILSTQNTASSQDVNHFFNVPKEAIFYAVIDKKRCMLIDAHYFARQRKKLQHGMGSWNKCGRP